MRWKGREEEGKENKVEGSSRVRKGGEGGRVEYRKDSRRRWKGRVEEG